jgi:hypothetical protein
LKNIYEHYDDIIIVSKHDDDIKNILYQYKDSNYINIILIYETKSQTQKTPHDIKEILKKIIQVSSKNSKSNDSTDSTEYSTILDYINKKKAAEEAKRKAANKDTSTEDSLLGIVEENLKSVFDTLNKNSNNTTKEKASKDTSTEDSLFGIVEENLKSVFDTLNKNSNNRSIKQQKTNKEEEKAMVNYFKYLARKFDTLIIEDSEDFKGTYYKYNTNNNTNNSSDLTVFYRRSPSSSNNNKNITLIINKDNISLEIYENNSSTSSINNPTKEVIEKVKQINLENKTLSETYKIPAEKSGILTLLDNVKKLVINVDSMKITFTKKYSLLGIVEENLKGVFDTLLSDTKLNPINNNPEDLAIDLIQFLINSY